LDEKHGSYPVIESLDRTTVVCNSQAKVTNAENKKRGPQNGPLFLGYLVLAQYFLLKSENSFLQGVVKGTQ
jgi:hypothetical protein